MLNRDTQPSPLLEKFLMFAATAALLAMLPMRTALADGPFRVVRAYAPPPPGYHPNPGGPGRPGYNPNPGPGRPGYNPNPVYGPGYNPNPGPIGGRPGYNPYPPGYNPNPSGPVPRPPVVVVPPRVPGQVYTPPPRFDNDNEEIEVTKLLVYTMRGGKGCDRAGEVLREMSNLLMSGAAFAARPGSPAPIGAIIRTGEGHEDARRRWAGHVNSPHFWAVVWERLTNMYRECNRGCFDDGVAVGQISATGYCSASIAVNGLNAPGFEHQGALPLCQNANFTGCISGYDQTSSTYPGCSNFATGGFTDIYNQSKSQDCHID